MVRFFDLTVKPGKSYRYRVRVMLEDPNRPHDPKADPDKGILHPTVIERLEQVATDDENYLKRTGKPRRTYYRVTDWSEPSNVVTVAQPETAAVAPLQISTGRDSYRTWTDVSGQHTVEAQFKGVAFSEVKLQKENGEQITLPIDSLSAEDQEWIENLR